MDILGKQPWVGFSYYLHMKISYKRNNNSVKPNERTYIQISFNLYNNLIAWKVVNWEIGHKGFSQSSGKFWNTRNIFLCWVTLGQGHVKLVMPQSTHNNPVQILSTFLFWMVHRGIWNRCIVGFVRLVYDSFVRGEWHPNTEKGGLGVVTKTLVDLTLYNRTTSGTAYIDRVVTVTTFSVTPTLHRWRWFYQRLASHKSIRSYRQWPRPHCCWHT